MLLTTAALYLCAAPCAHLSIDVPSELVHTTSSRAIKTDGAMGPSGHSDPPMTAAEYASNLARGVVATWAEFGTTIAAYNKQWCVHSEAIRRCVSDTPLAAFETDCVR
jgi:hypothetical protein